MIDNLEVNKEYYIVPIEYNSNNNIIKNSFTKHIAIFKKTVNSMLNDIKISHFSSYRRLKDKDTFGGYDVNLNNHFKFYQRTSPKIQEQWEKEVLI